MAKRTHAELALDDGRMVIVEIIETYTEVTVWHSCGRCIYTRTTIRHDEPGAGA